MSWFIEGKYSRLYFAIIASAQMWHRSGYTERHHIKPKSLGGSDAKENLVRLTAREHFICHRLLTKMTIGNARNSMVDAFWLMSNANAKITGRYVKLTSKAFQQLRLDHAKAASIALTGLKRLDTTNYKKPKTKTHAKNISIGRIGITFSPEHRAKLAHAKLKKWINKDNISKMVSEYELAAYLNDGWVYGRPQLRNHHG